jgi:geranyl-CoA carboxylase alpha subunit
MKQSDVRITGHAIEARLCAEDPADAFRPQLGKIDIFNRWGVEDRFDSGVATGAVVTDNYDSMLAKVIGTGRTRDEARRALKQNLTNLDVVGLRTNKLYLASILGGPDFARGAVDIGWAERQPPFTDDNLNNGIGAIAALYLAHGKGRGWTSTAARRTLVHLRERNSVRAFVVENDSVAGLSLLHARRARRGGGGEIIVRTDATRMKASVSIRDAWIQIDLDDGAKVALFEDVTYAPAEPKGASGSNVVRAPMAGRIVKVLAEPGATVSKNQVLVILEAMKMEHELKAAADGVVDAVAVKAGDQVAIRQTLVTLKPSDT